MEKLLYLPKWSEVLVQIYKARENYRYCQKISREVQTSINHLRSIVKTLEESRLIEIIPSKKIKKIRITKKGESIANAVLNIVNELGYYEKN